MRVLKVGVSEVGFRPFAPQGEAPGFEFPPDCGRQTAQEMEFMPRW